MTENQAEENNMTEKCHSMKAWYFVLESSLSDGSVAAAKSVEGTTLGRSKKVLVVGVANTLVSVKSSSS